ncbi:hypothetical protein QVD17_09804 [Tagetes erecta]|uniref:Calmodulin-binding domain-containing protein n=1 Tax=Tagetes erecta TaxID=13708 RepID=A0AAD8P5M4_TARER|nr:hypothetical protein QVD17_09804 [Tagetes erecta]
MNTPSERKSIGSGGGSRLAGGKTRRYSIGVISSGKSIGEEGNIVPNYLRASTGSCHDFCKFGKKNERSKSEIPIKFKRTTIVNRDKPTKTVVQLEKKNATLKGFAKPESQTRDEPVKEIKKDVVLPSKKPQVYKQRSSTNGKTAKNELKTFQRPSSLVKSSPVAVNREGSNGGIKKKDVKTVKRTGLTPKVGSVKKVVAKVTADESQSSKGTFSRAANLKEIKARGFKQVSPLKDQNRMQKTEPKHTLAGIVQAENLQGVNAESEVKPEIMEFDIIQPPMELVNPLVCNSSDSCSDKNVVEEESQITHPVYESSELFPDKEVLEEAALITPPVSESPESFSDDEVLENEFDYTDDYEEVEVSEDGSETGTMNVMEASVGKGKMVITEDKNVEAVKLRFRRGKVLDLQYENNSPRRLKFRRRVIEGNKDGQNIARKTYKNKSLDLQTEDKQRVSRRSFENTYVEESNESKNGPESVVLKHQGEQEKKDAKGLLNNVIEETASKLVESRKSKVKALVGAFETVISLQDGKPSLT